MNRYTIISIIAITGIVVPCLYGIVNVYAAQNIEYRWYGQSDFSLFELTDNGSIEFCNTVPFWSNFERIEMTVLRNDVAIGTFATESVVLDPNSSDVVHVTFTSSSFAMSLNELMTIDFVLDGGSFRVDPNEFTVILEIDTTIIGVIPYSTVTQLDMIEFDQMMNTENLSCD